MIGLGANEVIIDYTNHRGERAKRRIRPKDFIFGMNAYHKTMCYLLVAFDIEKDAERTFAMKDIHSWEEVKPSEA